jgi:hypothetical protein
MNNKQDVFDALKIRRDKDKRRGRVGTRYSVEALRLEPRGRLGGRSPEAGGAVTVPVKACQGHPGRARQS